MTYRTLGELRGVLLARLGMGAMGASGGANAALIDSFLYEGQKALYWMTDWRQLIAYDDTTTGIDQNQYDYPTACANDKRLLRLEVNYSGQWTELREGITTAMWSTMDTNGPPARYERFAQLLVYPKADQAYTLRTWYVADLGRFSQANDRTTLDDSMVLLHATTNAKAHYRQPDAELYKGQLDTLLSRIRGQSFGSNGVYRRGGQDPIERKPALVGRDD